MSLYDKASLMMTPSGVKATKLYSHKPHNGNGDFTFDRNNGTATRVNKDGLIETVAADVPRLDYPLIDGVVQDCPALLLEPAATQLIEYSEDFSQWTNTGSETIDTADAAISPDGSLNATKLQEANSSFGYHRISKTITASSSTDYALSIFAKKGTQKYIQLLLLSTSNSNTVSKVFDLENGTLGETIINGTATLTDSKIEDFGNGWYRCKIVGQLTTAPNTFRINLADSSTGNTTSLGMVQYTGDGNGNVYIFGAQLEQNSYSTSYIPNDGTTATITRNADVCNSAGTAAEFNDSEGVLYAEIAALANDSTNRLISINDGSSSNRVLLKLDDSSNQLNGAAGGGSVGVTLTDETQFNKIAIKYKLNDVALWVNGLEVDTDNSATMPTGLSQIDFDKADGTNQFYGKTKELAVFNEALTDSELEALTSWDSFNEMATGQEYTIR